MKRRSSILFALIFAALVTCGPENDGTEDQLQGGEALLVEGREYLAVEKFEDGYATFVSLEKDYPAYSCQAQYGMMLAKVQETVARVDTLVETASVLTGAPDALGITPAAQDFTQVLAGFLVPFEELFAAVRTHANYVVENGCQLQFPEGFPLDVGKEGSQLYAKAVFGYDWDEGVARAILATVDSLMASINFILAHRLKFEQNVEDQARIVGGVLEVIDDEPLTEQVSRFTWVSVARVAGVFPDLNPDLLTFADKSRMTKVDNQLAEAFRAIYHSDASGTTGIIPAMLARALDGDDIGDNVLGWRDENGDGIAGNDDTLHIGLVELDLASTVALPDMDGGIEFTLNSSFGNITEALRLAHEMIQILGDQMAGADADAERPRLGFTQINGIVSNIYLLDANVPTIPEAVEFDFGAFFVDPVPLRAILPYWYNDGSATINSLEAQNVDSFSTPFDVFMVEGETAVTSAAEPYVYGSDVTHFPDTFVFDTLGTFPETLSSQEITTDTITALDYEVVTPFPYVNWQDPSFHEVVWVNEKRLPVAPDGTDAFELAESFTVNKAVNSYLAHYIASDIINFD